MDWQKVMEKALEQMKSSGPAAAEPLLKQALDLAGDKLEYKAMTNFNLGLVYYDLKRPKDAETNFAQAIELIQHKLPEFNELYGMFLKTMTEFYEKENRLADSKKYYLLEVDHTKKMFGPKHPYVANMICELSDVLIKSGEFAEAEKELAGALEIITAARGPDHVQCGKIHANLSRCYAGLGRNDDAEYHKARAQMLMEKTPQQNRPDLQDSDNITEQRMDS